MMSNIHTPNDSVRVMGFKMKCCICREPSVVVIIGNDKCTECGNTVALCAFHLKEVNNVASSK